MSRAPAPAERVLVLGRSPEVLETVLQELAGLGIDAEGSIDPEQAPERFDGRGFGLIALGRGLAGPVAGELRLQLAQRNPRLRFIEVDAPVAARQIAEALNGAAPPAVDLAAYCARVGYSGPLTPTLDTLRSLQAHHIAGIPFEAIDALLDRPIDLAPAAVDAKLIHARRGGYCFEQNSLFARVLAAIGFAVDGLIGRVRWMVPPGSPPRSRSHMALRVTIDGVPWLVDVGFGGNVPPAPLRMDTPAPQPTAHDSFRLFPFGTGQLLQVRIGERWESLYELSGEPAYQADYECGNWFTSTHPGSHFRHVLIAARTTPEARYALRERQLTIRRPGQPPEVQLLDAECIERALAEIFGLPVEPAWRPLIERAAAAPV